jgi:hypothetical protein
MVRSVAKKVMWVGRATVFLVGLAVILALVFGVVSRAVAHSGVDTKLLHLGHSNVVGTATNPATMPTTLISTLADAAKSALIVQNKSGGSALDLRVNSSEVAPMKVNSNKVVTNLNADNVDGKSATDFYTAGSKVVDSTHADQADLAREAGIANAAGDADLLDGKDSAQFVQGNGITKRGQADVVFSNGSVTNILSITSPDVEVKYECPSSTFINNPGLWIVQNKSGSESVNLFMDNGSVDPGYVKLAQSGPGDHRGFEANRIGEHITFQVQSTTGTATIEAFSIHSASGCHAQAQALATR